MGLVGYSAADTHAMSNIELINGSATMTARADYLLVVEHGTLTTSDEVLRYVTELELAGQRFKLRRVLVDARSETDQAESRGDARGTMWRWIRSQRTFDLIGYVLRDEMTIARVNMTALSERLSVRAFSAVADGHRWLARARPSSTTLTPVRGVSSVPPPPMPMRTPMPPSPAPRTPMPSRLPTPPAGSARDSSTARLSRLTARTAAMSSQEADAVLGLTPRSPTPPRESARQTVKIPAVDDRSVDEILSARVVRGADPTPLSRPGEPGTPAEILRKPR